jgi:6-phosphofructokinase 1
MVAEGAGQDLFDKMDEVRDASGNIIHKDIGILLKDKIKKHFKEKNIEVNVKYFDLSYTIRSVPAHGADAVFCAMLAQNAVHAAMAGRTDMIIGHWGDHFTHVPIPLATRQRKKIDPDSQLWTSVKAATKF